MRAPMVDPLAGPHRARNDQERHLRLARLGADPRRHRRRPEGRRAEGGDREGRLSRHRQDHARRRRSARLPGRQVRDSPPATPSSTTPARTRRRSATRTGRCTSRWCPTAPAGFITGVVPYHWTQVVNIKRDPFETSIGEQTKTLFGMGGALAGPVTAYVYDWNMLPIGQALWLKELSTYIDFPPMQDPASYNLEQVIQQVQGHEVDPRGCRLTRGHPNSAGAARGACIASAKREGSKMKTMFALAVATALTAFPAVAEFSADLGVLTCKLKDVQNDIIYSSEKFACEFKPRSGEAQSYTGRDQEPGPGPVGDQGHDPGLGRARPDRRRRFAGSAEGKIRRRLGIDRARRRRRRERAGRRRQDSVTLQPLSASGIVGSWRLGGDRGIRALLSPPRPGCPCAGTPIGSGGTRAKARRRIRNVSEGKSY